MAEHNQLGKWGEQVAREYYIARGYAVRETNWRMNNLELDLIVSKGMRIVFVEVKTRRSDQYVDPVTAVNRTKRTHMINAANVFMRNCLPAGDFEWQFDIVIVVGMPQDYSVDCIEDAFLPSVRRKIR